MIDNTFLQYGPLWLRLAYHEIGTREVPPNRGPAVRRYVQMAGCGQEGDPWCAIFANAMVRQSGFAGTGSAAALSFTDSENFRKLSGPALGAIIVFHRGDPDESHGHVGFYRGELGAYVWVLGGNEHDMVMIDCYPKESGEAWGIVGYYWPTKAPDPLQSGPVIMPQGSGVVTQPGPVT